MGQPFLAERRIANILNCKLGSFRFIYLIMPVSDKNLSIEQWNCLILKLAAEVDRELPGSCFEGGD